MKELYAKIRTTARSSRTRARPAILVAELTSSPSATATTGDRDHGGREEFIREDLIADEQMVVTLTHSPT